MEYMHTIEINATFFHENRRVKDKRNFKENKMALKKLLLSLLVFLGVVANAAYIGMSISSSKLIIFSFFILTFLCTITHKFQGKGCRTNYHLLLVNRIE